MRKTQLFAAICGVVLLCSLVLAQAPVVNIDPKVHGNLAAAQKLVVQADQRIAEAQKINDLDMQGHAQKARDLLVQVNQELKAAAEAADAAAAARQKSKK